MPQRMCRLQLYDLVWSAPLGEVAAHFAVSSPTLKNACIKFDIPIPSRGHWAKVQAGKPTIKVALPARSPGMSDEIYLGARYYWQRTLSDEELLGPLPEPPALETIVPTQRNWRRIAAVAALAFSMLAPTGQAFAQFAPVLGADAPGLSVAVYGSSNGVQRTIVGQPFLGVNQGGTGVQSLPASSLLLGQGFGPTGALPVGAITPSSPGQVLMDQGPGKDPKFRSIFGAINIDANGQASLTAASVETFTQTGAGAVARTVQSKLSETAISVKDFGAFCDGVTDDTTKIQAAITAAQQAGSPSASVYFPPGTCVISTALTVSAPIRLYGDNFTTSIIQPAVGINAINITTINAVIIEKLGITYASNATGGTSAISVSPAGSTINSSSVFRDLQILNADAGISLVKAQTFVIDNVKISLFGSVAVSIQNTTNVDSGDSTITSSYFLARNSSAPACVQWVSSGGFRFVNNKCLTASDGLLVQLASGAVTAQMVVVGNSFDGMTGNAFRAIRSGATGTFARIVFNDNICNGVLTCVNIPSDPNGIWLTSLNIVGNTYIGALSGSPFGFVVITTQNFVIAHNTLQSQNAATVAIFTATTSNLGIVGPNIKIGTFAANTISSTNTTTIAPN